MNKKCVTFLVLISIILSMRVPIQIHASVGSEGYGSEFPINKLVIYDASQEDIDFVGNLEGLEKLSLSITCNSEVDLTPLTNLQNLQELSISINDMLRIGITDMSPLGKLKQLKKLSISECSSDYSFIKELKNLQELIINRADIGDLSFLEGLTELRYLSLAYVSDSDLSYLKGMSKMNQIYIDGYYMRNFESLGEMKYLTWVYLDNGVESRVSERDKETVNEIDLNVFAQADKLSGMCIQRIHIEDVTPISQLPQLETIVWVDTGITDIEGLKNLEKLKNLQIYGCRGVIEQVPSFPQLDRLIITDDIPNYYSR